MDAMRELMTISAGDGMMLAGLALLDATSAGTLALPAVLLMMSGRSRGITARVALELAVRYKPRLVLVGSSPEPVAEHPDTTPLTTADVESLGSEMFNASCGLCNAAPQTGHYLAHQWIGNLNAMKRFVALDDEQFRFLQKWVQLHAQDTGGHE